MAARLLLRNCVLAEEFQIREEGSETFLALQNPPPVGSVVTVVEDEGEGRSFRVARVVEVAESPEGIGCSGSFVDEPAPTTVGSEGIAPDPDAVRAVVARDPSLASRYSSEEAGEASEASEDAGQAAAEPADGQNTAAEPEADGEPATPADEAQADGAQADAGESDGGETEGGESEATEQASEQDGGEQNGGGKKKSKKKGKKRKGRKRG